MKKVTEVPTRYSVKLCDSVMAAKQLHSHDGEDKDDDGEDKTKVTECTHRTANDSYEEIECRPRFGQLKHPKLPQIEMYHVV